MVRIAISRRGLCSAGAVVLLAAIAVLTQPLLIAWHTGRARDGLQDRDYPRTMRELRRALWLAPDRAETLLLLARLHRRLGDAARTPALLRRAAALGADPDRVERESLLLLAQTGQLRESEPRLADLLVDPRDDGPDICEAYAQGYFANLRVAEATRLLDAWAAEYPRDPQAHFMRGYLMQAIARWPEAAAAYRRGLELAPRQTLMRFRLAETLSESDEAEEAGALFDQCVRESPESPEFVTGWAGHLFRRGDPNQARDALEHLLGARPDHFEARRLAGEIELSLGRFAEALRHLEAAARLRPFDTTTRNALGRALRALGRTEEAKPHFQYVAEAEPSLHRMEQQLRQVVLRPDDPELRYEIGATLLKYGSPGDGVKWLRTVLQLQPDHRGANLALAAYCETGGDPRAAEGSRNRPGGRTGPAPGQGGL